MTKERIKELETNDNNVGLTEKELKEGWFFCCELDYVLVNKNDKHIKDICLCLKRKLI